MGHIRSQGVRLALIPDLQTRIERDETGDGGVVVFRIQQGVHEEGVVHGPAPPLVGAPRLVPGDLEFRSGDGDTCAHALLPVYDAD